MSKMNKTVSSLMLSAVVLPFASQSAQTVNAVSNDDNANKAVSKDKTSSLDNLNLAKQTELAKREAAEQELKDYNNAEIQKSLNNAKKDFAKPVETKAVQAQPVQAKEVTPNLVQQAAMPMPAAQPVAQAQPAESKPAVENPGKAPEVPVEPEKPENSVEKPTIEVEKTQTQDNIVDTSELDAKIDEVIKAAKDAGLEVIETPAKTVNVAEADIEKAKAEIEADYSKQIEKIKSETQKYLDQVEEQTNSNAEYTAKKAEYDKAKAQYDKDKAEYDKKLAEYENASSNIKVNDTSEWTEQQIKDFLGKDIGNVTQISGGTAKDGAQMELVDVNAKPITQDDVDYYNRIAEVSYGFLGDFDRTTLYGRSQYKFFYGEKGVNFRYKNALTDPKTGRNVDVKLTIVDFKSYGQVQSVDGQGHWMNGGARDFQVIGINPKQIGVNQMLPFGDVKWHVEYLDTETGAPVELTGLVGLADLDYMQYATLPKENFKSTLSGGYVSRYSGHKLDGQNPNGDDYVSDKSQYQQVVPETLKGQVWGIQTGSSFDFTFGAWYGGGRWVNDKFQGNTWVTGYLHPMDDYWEMGNIKFVADLPAKPVKPTKPVEPTPPTILHPAALPVKVQKTILTKGEKIVVKPDKTWNDIENPSTPTNGKVYFIGEDAQATVKLPLPKQPTAEKITHVSITDDYSQFSDYVDWKETRVFENGADVSDAYEITVDKDKGLVTAVRKDPASTPEGDASLVTTWTVKKDVASGTKFINAGEGQINDMKVPTNKPDITIYNPEPEKHWVNAGKVVDNGKFIAGAQVNSSVYGNIPEPDNTVTKITKVEIEDDFSDMKDYVSVAKDGIKVLESDKDVTDLYDIKTVDGKIIATRKSMEGLAAGQLKLNITWNVNKTVADGVKLHNKGSMRINNIEVPTNEPDIFIYHPTPEKDVDMGYVTNNPEGSINGKTIATGSKLTYSLFSNKELAAGRIDDITSLRFEDKLPEGTTYTGYKAHITIDGKVIEVTDLFTVKQDGNQLVFTAKKELFEILNKDKSKALKLPVISLYATVDKDGIDIKNTYDLFVNNLKDTSNEVVNHTPKVTPVKKVLNKAGEDINDKQVVRGDTLNYQMVWDLSDMKNMVLSKEQLAKGMSFFDDFSEDDVTPLKNLLSVKSKATGKDVMKYLTVKWDDEKGAFTLVVKNPEEFMKLFAGDQLIVDFFVKVNKDAKHTEFTNTASQNNFGNEYKTNTVINRIPKISPKKDVVISTKDKKSLDNKEIALDTLFDYKLQTSNRPANYGGVTEQWSVIDKFDLKHDQFTGNWNVFAEHDFVLKDGTKVSAGTDITKYFKMTYNKETGRLEISANKEFLDIMNLEANKKTEQGWSAYVQMKRIATGTVYNVVDESYNGEIIQSNKVKTTTPEKPVVPTPEQPKAPLLKTNEKQQAEGAALVAMAAAAGIIGLAATKKRKRA